MRIYYYLATIVASGLILISNIFKPGLMKTHDGIWHVRRIIEMLAMLRLKYFPVRWGLTLDNKFGTPIFNYLYPGPYYFAAALNATGIGTLTSLKLVTTAFYILGGVGFFLLFRRRSPTLATILAFLYLLTPYQFLNIFVRGSLGEIVVLGLFPFVLLFLNNLKERQAIRWYDPLPFAIMLISHNFLSLIFFGFYLLYILIQKEHKILQYKSLALSLALAAFFVLPMIAERQYLYSTANQDYSFRYQDHFVYPQQLLYSKWDHWFSMPGIENDGMSFQLGFTNIAIILLSLLTLILARLRRQSKKLWLYLGIFFVCIFSMLPLSNFLWQLIPIMQIIQFPWRLLAVTTVLTPLVAYEIFSPHITRKKSRKYLRVLLFLLVSLAVYNTRNYRSPLKNLSDEEYLDLHRLYVDATATSLRSELVPYWAPDLRWMPDNNGLYSTKSIGLEEGQAALELISEHPGNIIVSASAENEQAVMIIYRNYFPSWKVVQDDSVNLTISPSEDGSILIPLAEGTHTYQLSLSSTPTERLANLISLITILYLVSLPLKKFSNRK